MNKTILILTLLLAALPLRAQQVLPPESSYDGAFAIVVDRATYDALPDAVDAYRAAVEGDGLSTYVVIDAWERPEDVRAAIQELARQDARLEGVALVGDIPIAMIRGAQHMTSSFKIDEHNLDRFSLEATSVPSDRFYDDFDLAFRFVEQDTADAALFYYELTETSPQRLDPELYSGRMLVRGEAPARYERLARYLYRVAAARAEPPAIDRAFVFTGHGYNSEALSAWEGEGVALREQFPQLTRPGGMLKSVHVANDFRVEDDFMAEVQDPALDLAIFHAHGTTDAQLLTRYAPPRTMVQDIQDVQFTLRTRLRRAVDRGRDPEEEKARLAARYDVPLSWFENTFDDSLAAADAERAAALDLTHEEIASMRPQPYVALFDQCFNGAFHQHPFVAGSYVFGDGRTVAALAASVNVMQDVWPGEHLGLLGQGLRLGTLTQLRPRLEGHIIGDPTFRYEALGPREWNATLRNHAEDASFWLDVLEGGDVPARALALKMLHRIGAPDAEAVLVRAYHEDASYVVRMQALTALAERRTPAFYDLLTTSISDPYELARRISAHWMGDAGREAYLPLLTERVYKDPSKRVSYVARSAIQKIDFVKALDYNAQFLAEHPAYAELDGMDQRTTLSYGITAQRVREELVPTMQDEKAELEERIGALRTFRFYRYSEVVPALVAVARDEGEPVALRVAALEALGWYVLREDRAPIVAAAAAIAEAPDAPEAVRREAEKTRSRIEAGFTHPITL